MCMFSFLQMLTPPWHLESDQNPSAFSLLPTAHLRTLNSLPSPGVRLSQLSGAQPSGLVWHVPSAEGTSVTCPWQGAVSRCSSFLVALVIDFSWSHSYLRHCCVCLLFSGHSFCWNEGPSRTGMFVLGTLESSESRRAHGMKPCMIQICLMDKNIFRWAFDSIIQGAYSVVSDSDPRDCSLPGFSLFGIL